MDDEIVKSTAEAVKATAELGSKTIDASAALGRVFKGPLVQIAGMVDDQLRAWRWERQLRLIDRAERIMRERGMKAPTRELPLDFSWRLLQQATIQEDSELQEMWAQLLVNAGDASTSTEPRAAFVQILSELTAFDARNMAVLAEGTLNHQGKVSTPNLETWTLPESTIGHDEIGQDMPLLSEHIAVSISNLNRLGIIEAASATFGGKPIFQYVSVTPLGLAFYRACSERPLAAAR
jgi:hypothetical protein